MHIVVPMAGAGTRFIRGGYTQPKPLIRVDGRPMIEHVVNLFPGESRFTFLCNREHLEQSPMRLELERIAPGCVVRGIEPHKLGPVHSVALAFDCLDDDETIVNYCDFGTWWDYHDFLARVRASGAQGAAPAYRGFHPHMLGCTNYAFMRNHHEWMLEIKEKAPFTDDRTREFASNGTYYFRSGALIVKYFNELLQSGIRVADEFYVSMGLNLLRRDGLKVMIYEIQHMLQWGTPQDLEEYAHWSGYFRAVCAPHAQNTKIFPGVSLIPMAGQSRRFQDAGFAVPKPMLPVNGKPMAVQAAQCMPRAQQTLFACLADHLDRFPVKTLIESHLPGARIIALEKMSRGQAETCGMALRDTDPDSPVFVGACDNGMLWDIAAYEALLREPDTDAVIWTFRNNPACLLHPEQYGWVRTMDGKHAAGVSVKKTISRDVARDHAVVGAFTFRSARIFLRGLEHLISRDIRVNGEFYIDSLMHELIGLGFCVKIFQVDHYAGWGTPGDYRTYEYWQSYFHKCLDHPYTLDDDPFVDAQSARELDIKYRTFAQPGAAEPDEAP